jgi:hypothetical protein
MCLLAHHKQHLCMHMCACGCASPMQRPTVGEHVTADIVRGHRKTQVTGGKKGQGCTSNAQQQSPHAPGRLRSAPGAAGVCSKLSSACWLEATCWRSGSHSGMRSSASRSWKKVGCTMRMGSKKYAVACSGHLHADIPSLSSRKTADLYLQALCSDQHPASM